MRTQDGTRLDADVYYPDTPGEYPVLLMRQPYGRAIASTVVYAHPSWYAAQGYIVVIQDVRGRGSSEGQFQLFAHEQSDGLDTVNWAATLPQSTGDVGMYGFSYQGMTQLYAAAAQPAALKTICPSMVGYDLYHDWAYEGGAFCYQLNLSWAIQLAAETARREGDREVYQALYAAARNPPLSDPIAAQSELLSQLAPDSFYHDWLAHPQPDAYWQNLSPSLANVDLPMLHIGGWFDTYMRGTLRLYLEMAARQKAPQHLWVGPWAHLPWGRKVGSLDYGADANSPIDRLQIRWFDYFLKGKGELDQPICLFEMGSNQWRKWRQFPGVDGASPTENRAQSYDLVTTGLAAMDEREGKLIVTGSAMVDGMPDTWVHDPWRPLPASGGHAVFPAGSFERSAIDCRSDIVTYTSAPLPSDLHLAGVPKVLLYCSADSPSFDLCAVLSEVNSTGTYNFSQGYQRVLSRGLSDALSDSIQFNLQPTCIRISKGSAIRLSLSAACFPAYTVNPGIGQELMDAQVITLTLSSSSDRPSQLILPITG